MNKENLTPEQDENIPAVPDVDTEEPLAVEDMVAEADLCTEPEEEIDDLLAPISPKPVRTDNTRKRKLPLSARKLKYGSVGLVLSIVVLVGVVLLNVVVSMLYERFPLNWDITAEKNYALSAEGIAVASAIKEPVEIIVFATEDTFNGNMSILEELNTIMRQFKETLNQYVGYSGGKVSITYLDPERDTIAAAKYDEYEVGSGSILFLSGTGDTKRSSRSAIAELFTYDEQAFIQNGILVNVVSLAERVVATNIRKVAGNLKPVIMLTGHGEDAEIMASAKNVLNINGYEVEEHDFTTAATLNETANTIFIAAPMNDFSNEDILRLRTWLENEGENTGTMYGRHITFIPYPFRDCPNLYEFFEEEYGIKVTQDMIMEENENNLTAMQYFGEFGTYASVPDSSLTASLTKKRVFSPLNIALELKYANDPDALISNIPLVTFPDTARLCTYDAETGAYSEETRRAEVYPIVGMALAQRNIDNKKANIVVNSDLLVIGSFAFLESGYYSQLNVDNEPLFLHAFGSFAGNGDDVIISSRVISNEILEYNALSVKIIGTWIFMAGLPICTLGIGLLVFLRRRHR